ncbi:MAG: hypothetical protein B6I24_09790 [Bacteroidetes bacterium 4572_128]|nr:MAG: hypothetical protein B6I24_09790 [Bacteroidetes bacterium 4572_128]
MPNWIIENIGWFFSGIGVTILVWAIPVILKILKNIRSKKIKIISLKVSDELLLKGNKFSVLHICNDSEKIDNRGTLLNKVIPFKKLGDRGNLIAKIKHPKHLGFQFKCFIDYSSTSFEELKDLLEKEGYTDISKGEGKSRRLWFIHPEYSKVLTVDKIINNYLYPE